MAEITPVGKGTLGHIEPHRGLWDTKDKPLFLPLDPFDRLRTNGLATFQTAPPIVFGYRAVRDGDDLDTGIRGALAIGMQAPALTGAPVSSIGVRRGNNEGEITFTIRGPADNIDGVYVYFWPRYR